MAAVTFFSVTGTYLAALRDNVYDVDNDPQLTPMTGSVTFTPLIDAGDSLPVPTLTPPANLWLVPIKAQIVAGQITTNGVTGVKLVANTAVLALQGNLYYRVDFYDGLIAGGVTHWPDAFTFQAPTTATTLDLVTVTPVAGQPAQGAGAGAVTSVAGRTGAIVLTSADINATGTASATTFLRGDNTWATPAGGGGGGGAVSSVAGRTGDVTLTKTDVGLSNVDNTSDVNKPVSTAQAAADALAEKTANKNQANGYAGLDGTGKVAAAQLPSYVDDVLDFANLAAFPGAGSTGIIYVADDTGLIYRWSGSAYVNISASPGSTDAVPEGSTNKYYTDARAQAANTSAIAAAVSTAEARGNHTGTQSADTIVDGSTNKVLSAADKTRLANTSGTNTGDQSAASLGLGNVANTSDANKPVSTAQAAAIALKAPLFTTGAAITTNTAPAVGVITVYDPSAGPLSVTLPTLSGLSAGALFGVQLYENATTASGSPYPVTFTPNGSDAFDAGTTSARVLRTLGELRFFQVVSIASTLKWKVVGGNTTLTGLDARFQPLQAKKYGLTSGRRVEITADGSGATAMTSYGTVNIPIATVVSVANGPTVSGGYINIPAALPPMKYTSHFQVRFEGGTSVVNHTAQIKRVSDSSQYYASQQNFSGTNQVAGDSDVVLYPGDQIQIQGYVESGSIQTNDRGFGVGDIRVVLRSFDMLPIKSCLTGYFANDVPGCARPISGSWTNRSTWADVAAGIWDPTALAWCAANPTKAFNFGSALIPHGGIASSSWNTTLDAVTAGTYDTYFTQLGTNLAAQAPNTIYVRPWWEVDQDGVRQNVDPTKFKAAWHRAIPLMRSAFAAAAPTKTMKITYCYLGTSDYANSMDYYPTSETDVDILGSDIYAWIYGSSAPTWPQVAKAVQTRLDTLVKNATAHSKPFSVDEWGTGTTVNGGSPGSWGIGDDARLVDLYFNWVEKNAPEYILHFNITGASSFSLADTPNMATALKQRHGLLAP